LKLTAKIELRPSQEQAALLLATLSRCNECANWLSHEAFERKVFAYFALQKPLYHKARELYGLSAQLTVRVFSKVADAYKLGKTERKFGPKGAIAFDDRILSFREGAVSIWTLQGRQVIPYVAGPRQIEQLKQRQGESDLLYHRGKWFLAVTCNVEEPTLREVDEFLGIDMGIANIASDSDGGNYSGDTIKGVRFRHRRLRTKLQKKQTRGARRKLRELSGREYRFASDTNHCISKQIVAKAKDTEKGIAIEDLRFINSRLTVRLAQRVVLRSWAFAQLRAFLEYKARLAGIPLVVVDPRNSSRECSQCGHIAKSNRPSQSVFRCGSCGYESNADFNAAVVIRGRACADRPNVARNLQRQAYATG
jgi:putative transposase